jgi:hypothetical protein
MNSGSQSSLSNGHIVIANALIFEIIAKTHWRFKRGILISDVSQMDMQASSTFSEAFDFASGAIGERFQNPFWRLTDLFLGARLRRAVSEVKRFGRSIVAVAVQKRSGKLLEGTRITAHIATLYPEA